MTNYIVGSDLPDDNSVGGAYVISAEGEVIASKSLGEEGILLVNIDKTKK